MKIVFTINSLAKGGAERVMSLIANHFSKNNDVYIITMINVEIAYKLNSNIKVIPLAKNKHNSYKKKNNKFSKIMNIFKFYSRTLKMKKVLNEIKPDIIISFLPEVTFMTLLAKNKNTKIIISDRNDPNTEYNSKIYNFLFKKLFVKVNGYVFQTNDAKDYYLKNLNLDDKKIKIIFNPINMNFLVDRYNGKREKEIVSVGRLTEQKNFELLINSFINIEKEIPEYKLIIYGEGNQRNKLEEIIKENKLQNRILLPGVIDNIKDKIYKSSLFVLSSKYEGMPNALIEAMAIGLPVISTDCPCGGSRMLIENEENGILVKNNDVNELSNAIKKVLNDKELREKISSNAIKIQESVKPEIIYKEWDDFIKEVLKG